MVISDTLMQIAQAPGKTTPSMMLTVEILGRNEWQGEGEREVKGRKGGKIKKKKRKCIRQLQSARRGRAREARAPSVEVLAQLPLHSHLSFHFNALFCISER